MLNRHLTEAHNVYQNQFYSILTEKIAADLSSDTFESVRSTLVFNLAKWPLGALDPQTDNSEYSCQSTSSSSLSPWGLLLHITHPPITRNSLSQLLKMLGGPPSPPDFPQV